MLQIYYDFQAFFFVITLFSCSKSLREWFAMIIISKEELQKRFGEFEKHIEIVVDWFCCLVLFLFPTIWYGYHVCLVSAING